MNDDEAWQYLKEQAGKTPPRVFRVIPRKKPSGRWSAEPVKTFKFTFCYEDGETRIETYCIKKLAALVKAVIEGGAA